MNSLVFKKPVVFAVAIAAWATLYSTNGFLATASAQNGRAVPKPVGKFEVTGGQIRTIRPGKIVVAEEQGGRRSYLIQDKDEDATTVGGRIMRLPAQTIKVRGKLPARLLEDGMVIKFTGKLNRAGKSKGTIDKFEVVDLDSSDWYVKPAEEPDGANFVDCEIIGRVRYVREKDWKVLLEVPKTKMTRNGRINFILNPESNFEIKAEDLNGVRRGDKIVKMNGLKFNTGEWVIREIEVEMDPNREKATFSFHEQLELKFSGLSDEPGEPRTVSSKHFTLRTDISDRQAQVLLAKLETMYELIGRYFGRLSPKPIECFVVRDLRKWQSAGLPARAVAKIAEPAGVTISLIRTIGKRKEAISQVYSCDNQGVVQHEAVHAICSQAFGGAGPIWYAEGMAEVGQYWKPDDLAVNIDPVAIQYLTSVKKAKSLNEIVKAGQITGDSWQAYCWRWALCHMLANNPNYSRTFKKLGIAMMREQEGATFDAAYGKYAKEIEFEYHFFCKHFDNGYRVDLCYWDWDKVNKAKKIKGPSAFTKSVVQAHRGWQGTTLVVEKGVKYEYMNKGEWTIEKDGDKLTAAGYQGGLGGLVGIVFKDYKLGEPFPLGEERGTFVAPEDGILFLRCKDDLLELGDNDGEITTYFRLAPVK